MNASRRLTVAFFRFALFFCLISCVLSIRIYFSGHRNGCGIGSGRGSGSRSRIFICNLLRCSILIFAESVVQIHRRLRTNPCHVAVSEKRRRTRYIPFASVVNHSSDVSVRQDSKSPFIFPNGERALPTTVRAFACVTRHRPTRPPFTRSDSQNVIYGAAKAASTTSTQ